MVVERRFSERLPLGEKVRGEERGPDDTARGTNRRTEMEQGRSGTLCSNNLTRDVFCLRQSRKG